MVTGVTNKMKLNISKIKDNIIVIGLTMVISKALWYVAKGINTIFKKDYQIDDDHRHFSEKWDDEDEILGV